MGNTSDVEKDLPGLRFYGVIAEERSNRVGTRTGTITMSCEIHDKKLWDMAIEKFEDFKVFSSATEEVLSALSDELDTTYEELQEANAKLEEVQATIREKDDKIAELEGILATIGADLGIT
jgi:ElaB/YqjD/DUF883 family membrane-anchored ribosome-binding protein